MAARSFSREEIKYGGESSEWSQAGMWYAEVVKSGEEVWGHSRGDGSRDWREGFG